MGFGVSLAILVPGLPLVGAVLGLVSVGRGNRGYGTAGIAVGGTFTLFQVLFVCMLVPICDRHAENNQVYEPLFELADAAMLHHGEHGAYPMMQVDWTPEDKEKSPWSREPWKGMRFHPEACTWVPRWFPCCVGISARRCLPPGVQFRYSSDGRTAVVRGRRGLPHGQGSYFLTEYQCNSNGHCQGPRYLEGRRTY